MTASGRRSSEGGAGRLDAEAEADHEERGEDEAGERRDRDAEEVVHPADAGGGEVRQRVDAGGDLRRPAGAVQHVEGHAEGAVAGERPDDRVQHPVPDAEEARGGKGLDRVELVRGALALEIEARDRHQSGIRGCRAAAPPPRRASRRRR